MTNTAPTLRVNQFANTQVVVSSQVAFHRPTKITAVALQGRADFDQWVTSYTLSYSEDGGKYSVYSVGGQQKV